MDGHFRVLGLPRNCTETELKRAYRQKALQLHPDRNPNGAEAFKRVNAAYEALTVYLRRNPSQLHSGGGGNRTTYAGGGGSGGDGQPRHSSGASPFDSRYSASGAAHFFARNQQTPQQQADQPQSSSAKTAYRYGGTSQRTYAADGTPAGACRGGGQAAGFTAAPDPPSPLFTEAELFNDDVPPGGWNFTDGAKPFTHFSSSTAHRASYTSGAQKASPPFPTSTAAPPSSFTSASEERWRRAHGARVPVSAYNPTWTPSKRASLPTGSVGAHHPSPPPPPPSSSSSGSSSEGSRVYFSSTTKAAAPRTAAAQSEHSGRQNVNGESAAPFSAPSTHQTEEEAAGRAKATGGHSNESSTTAAAASGPSHQFTQSSSSFFHHTNAEDGKQPAPAAAQAGTTTTASSSPPSSDERNAPTAVHEDAPHPRRCPSPPQRSSNTSAAPSADRRPMSASSFTSRPQSPWCGTTRTGLASFLRGTGGEEVGGGSEFDRSPLPSVGGGGDSERLDSLRQEWARLERTIDAKLWNRTKLTSSSGAATAVPPASSPPPSAQLPPRSRLPRASYSPSPPPPPSPPPRPSSGSSSSRLASRPVSSCGAGSRVPFTSATGLPTRVPSPPVTAFPAATPQRTVDGASSPHDVETGRSRLSRPASADANRRGSRSPPQHCSVFPPSTTGTATHSGHTAEDGVPPEVGAPAYAAPQTSSTSSSPTTSTAKASASTMSSESDVEGNRTAVHFRTAAGEAAPATGNRKMSAAEHQDAILHERRLLQRQVFLQRYAPDPADVGTMGDAEVYVLASMLEDVTAKVKAVLAARLTRGMCSRCQRQEKVAAQGATAATTKTMVTTPLTQASVFLCRHACVCADCAKSATECPLCGSPALGRERP